MKILLFAAAALLAAFAAAAPVTIVLPDDAPPPVRLAAKELRRYIFLRTGALPDIAKSAQTGAPVIAFARDPALGAQSYRLRSDGRTLTVSGGSPVAELYGAYAFVEKLGVRFELNGDVLPDDKIAFALPVLDETKNPLFALRGLQPFHDFPEGPDWWTQDQWRLYLGQAVKMRMNFVGLHTYPQHNPDLGPEPLVWFGVPGDVNADGTVKVADPTSWYTTAKHMPYGCYAPGKTGDYAYGADQVFPTDDHGPEINGAGDFPLPKTPAASVALQDRLGPWLKTIFAEARERGMKIAVGTEAPLDMPDTAVARLKEQGLDPKSPDALRRLYAGAFTRISRAFPVDYYWLWGHEGEIDPSRFVGNVLAAHEALKDAGASFSLGICGWGWTAGHFPGFHKKIPGDVFFSAISASTGHVPVSGNFGGLGERSRFAIPWLEDDGSLTSIQLRAGRTRRDASDALRLGCDGLMGIFWRTRVMGPNLEALARAGWEQDGWASPKTKNEGTRDITVVGGRVATFLNDKVAGTDIEPVYQTVRFDMSGYRFRVPDGDYRVTLHFAEPAYKAAGKRVFGVRLQNRQVLEHLDVFARVGAFAALKLPFDGVTVKGGVLKVDFTPETEFPIIAAIEIVGTGAGNKDVVRKVNCGGQAFADFAEDPSAEVLPRDLPCDDLYADWCRSQFGPEAGPEAAAIFTKLDGRFPSPSAWLRGPGGIATQGAPWSTVSANYAFADAFAALRPKVRGAAALERFDFWSATFRATRAMGEFGCARGELDRIMAGIAKTKDAGERRRLAREKALPVRLRMTTLLGELHNALLESLTNSTELGTLCNIDQQSMRRLHVLDGHDAALAKALGEPLPPEAAPWKDYRGVPRLVVLNPRTGLVTGETQALDIVAPGCPPDSVVTVRVRPLGGADADGRTLSAVHVARAVWRAKLPPASSDFEYTVETKTTDGKPLRWPASGAQTVVVE